MALLETIDRVSDALDKKRTTVCVLIDLSKAFDTIDHTILLNKLDYYGIKGLALEWFKTYLIYRLQYVKIGGVSSHMLPITCWVPQGSILGPLLFLIYANDLAMCYKFLKFIIYRYVSFADDTNIFFSDKSIDYCYEIFTNELINLSEWFKANKLSLNLKKKQNIFILAGKKV